MKPMFLVNLAWKNLTRYKRRTFITVIVLAVGIGIYILVDSMLIGARQASELNLQRYEVGSAKITTEEYWQDRKDYPLKSSIENPQDVLDDLEAAGIHAVPRIQFQSNVTIQSGIGGSFPAVVTGIDIERDQEVFQIIDAVDRGRMPRSNEEAVAIGSWMAVDLGLEIGDFLTLQIVDRAGGNDALELEIVGLVDSPNPIVNMAGMYVPLDTLDYYLYMEGTVTEIVLGWPSGLGVKQGMAEAQDIVDRYGLDLRPWQDWSKEYIAASQGDKYGSFIILMLIFIIAAVGFSNTLLMSLLERVPETGMMRALGCSKGDIRRLFMTESLLQGLLGSLGGIILGVAMNIPLVLNGIDYSRMMRDMGNVGYRFTGVILGIWAPSSYIIAFFSGIAIAFFVSFFSIEKTLRLKITDSVRGN